MLSKGNIGDHRGAFLPLLGGALPLLMSALGFFGFMGWRRRTAVAA